jgi:acetyltransferase-like isoleucine patch superfamily enzyme
MCFIPEGVTIEDNCFIAPRVSFSNDKRPPSKKEFWGKITIKKNAAIGMGAIILPGVMVGEGAIVGAGAVVTKSIPAGEKWFGVPAMPHGERSQPEKDTAINEQKN